MNTTLRHGFACALALLLAACGGADTSNPRPTLTMSTVQATTVVLPVSAYNDVVQRIYVGYFGRPADPAGLDYWAKQYNDYGMPLKMADISSSYASNANVRQFVDAFGASQESADLYPGDNAAFITAIYRNLFNRDPDAAGKAYWVDSLNKGLMTRAIAALYIMSGAQSSDATIIDKKIEVATRFSTALVTDAERLAYTGMTASAQARTMLSEVGLSTDTATFAGVTNLIAKLTGQGPLPSRISAYVGTWASTCDADMHAIETIVVTESMSVPGTVYIAERTDFYATPNCSGAPIATLTVSVPSTAALTGTANASVVLSPGSAGIAATVDLVSVSIAAHTISVTGPNVTHTVVNGQAQWCATLPDGTEACIEDNGTEPAVGPENMALYLSGNTMYLLSPSGSVYTMDSTFIRK